MVLEERMSTLTFWPELAAAMTGLGCYTLFHVAGVLIERRQIRRRYAHLRSRLYR